MKHLWPGPAMALGVRTLSVLLSENISAWLRLKKSCLV
jgi:hypothetical protein